MSASTPNIAIVGLGFGAEFIPIYQRHPNANMVAICQRTQSTLDEIGDKYGADYALFSYYRDYQASGGRVAFSILAAVAGVGVSTGSERGFASLVDLRSGDIVWCNQLTTGIGELRYKEGSRATIDALFKDLPES